MGANALGEAGHWFDAYGSVLVLYARQWLAEPSAADVVQDVFCRLLARDQDRKLLNPKAWLFQAVRNAAMSRLRSRLRRRRREREVAAGRSEWFEPQPGDLIDAASAQTVLAELPPLQREVIVMRLWGQLTWREIGQVTHQSIATTARTYKAALAAMRERLEARCKTRTNTKRD